MGPAIGVTGRKETGSEVPEAEKKKKYSNGTYCKKERENTITASKTVGGPLAARKELLGGESRERRAID